ncbi:MAG TPA: acetyl-CoA C-acetyltransferase [Actinomycetota bacterium]|nr:acetyl-CoA C-acetyltransferase [Actinomycetota bacterium]
MSSSVIVAGARTPIGRFRGALAGFSGVDLGAVAIRGALERAGVDPARVDYVIMGQVLRAGTGQITARQAAVAAGIPREVPALNVDKVCLSGMNAIALADQLIRAGEVDLVVAGGMESMTNAPYVIPAARDGSRLGHTEMIDSMQHDGLWSTFSKTTMGEASDRVNAELGIGREEQDVWAARSHQRAAAAWDEGRLTDEVVPVEVPRPKGDPVVFDRDEGIRSDSTIESLGALKPAFVEGGTITAGNASQISDGAAAVVVASRERAEELGVRPLAEIVAHGMSAGRFSYLHTVPALALQAALKKAGLDVHDLELIEVNEAFAAVALNVTRMLGVAEAIVNVNGGAVALGHPIGASGARLVLTLAHELRRRRLTLGGASICGGGGQGDALVIRNPAAN